MPVIDARHLTAVSETALLTLHQRATEAARADGVIDDPMAIALRDSLGYDYHHFGRTHQATALRASAFDTVCRQYLTAHRRATVVALAEGLQTSFWRVDNGELNWLSVDLEPIVQLRQALLPASDRLRHLAQSVLDHSWMDHVEATHGVLVTAEGLFQYLPRDEVFSLIAACATRFPGGRLVFDSVPRYLSWYSQWHGIRLTKHYTAPPMPFSFTAEQYGELRALPGVCAVYEAPMPAGRGKILSRAGAFVYRSPRLQRFRAPNNVIEFG
ncbi:methyltransferase [Mycobacterium sp. NS-7484]|uniref:class I SAM-dependent methyltransferase n=1 Tax=Mycobacterium sp. NS-7484 TaxID=1834161 RepID=UPI00096CAFB0|nr:class I SAM-dependent methyltransferase [Mycobacterium sp. NS-7484]OMB95089.1 methyltransferase [Mycobacterium sp. NS-7484]